MCCFEEIIPNLEVKISNDQSSLERSQLTVNAFRRKTVIELAVYGEHPFGSGKNTKCTSELGSNILRRFFIASISPARVERTCKSMC